jgi:membrane associated rhomboid family serine protease
MIGDRDYMREDSGSAMGRFRWSAATVLMVTLTVVFALQCINDVYLQTLFERDLGLTSAAFGQGHVWQFITFQFLHVSLWHLLGNLMGLWFIGRFVDQVLGTPRVLAAYFGCGLLGGLLQGALLLAFPGHFGLFTFGASAGITGIFAIFAMLMRDSTIRVNFILPIRADVLLWITGAISLFFTLVPSGRGGCVAHAAHLGGLIGGVLWVRLGWHRDFIRLPWERLWDKWQQRAESRDSSGSVRQRRVAFGRMAAARRAPAAEGQELPPEEFISKEVDPILDKISQHGIQSLTDHEKKVLEAARSKMARR